MRHALDKDSEGNNADDSSVTKKQRRKRSKEASGKR
jgi:hypothetical protein